MNQLQTIIDGLWVQAQLVFAQLKTFSLLYAEFIACLIVASVISLFIGSMLNRSKARKKLNSAIETWEKRYTALELNARIDTENLEEQLQSLAVEAKELHAKNKRLSDALNKNSSNVQRTRAEAIELSRQHAETQERLQRIIQQKDREIAALSALANQHSQNTPAAQQAGVRKQVNRQSPQAASDSDVLFADTVVISSADTNTLDSLDKTVQMSPKELNHQRPSNSKVAQEITEFDDLLEDSSDLDNVKIEEFVESTVVMDEEALAYARQPQTASSSRTNK